MTSHPKKKRTIFGANDYKSGRFNEEILLTKKLQDKFSTTGSQAQLNFTENLPLTSINT
jgi:hypothetical protein